MSQESDQNEEEIRERDALALASLLFDIYQDKKLKEKENVSSNI
jgi:hypothetical protein